MMKSNRDRGGPSAAVQSALERDALATRPPFSATFHERLMDRIVCEVASGPNTERLRRKASPPASVRILARSGGGVAALIVASWAVVWLAGRLGGGPGTDDVTAGSAPVAVAVQQDDGERLVAIETLPLYDDLDSGLRASVWTLAESLIELPDWANLADFDAAASQSAGSRP